MPIFLDGGTNEVEDPILLDASTLQSSLGAEYRSGRRGIFRARGRDKLATVSGITWQGAYYAGYDDDSDWLVVQSDSSYYRGRISAGGISLSSSLSWGSSPLPVTGVHYGGRHYLVNGVSNAVGERDAASGITFRSPGMNAPSLTLGVSVTQGSSQFSATNGLIYWLTEYDHVRGLESVAGSTSSSTGTFSSKDSVVLTITGTSKNPNVTRYRIYRTNDGGAFPDGGMLAEIGVSNSTYVDTYSNVASLLTPSYGTLPIGELSFNRDEVPPVLEVIGSFQDSLWGFSPTAPRELRYTPAGYPESWPSIFAIPLNTHRHDKGIAGVEYFGSLAIFTRDSVHRVTRFNREVDNVFSPSEAIVRVTDERGCVSRRGVALFSLPGQGARLAFVARDGIWETDLDRVMPVTDGVAWESRIDINSLSDSELINDPTNRRLVFIYRKLTSDGSSEPYPTGVMYLDYQGEMIRVTHGDHGPLSAAALAPYNGMLRLLTTDSRDANGSVYVEDVVERDDSELTDTSGSVHFKIRTKEYMPAGTNQTGQLGTASWLHSIGPAAMTHRFYYDRFDHAETRSRDWSDREIDDIGLNRNVNSLSLELESTSTASFSVSYLDVEGLDTAGLGPSEGA